MSGLSIGSQVIQALLPLGGMVVSLIEMYADESYGGDDSHGPLCVGGYLYERDQAVTATEEWVAVLNDPDLPHPLPFFRMSDCAHAMGVFRGLDEHCDRIARKMIPIPRTRSIVAFAATVDQADYVRIVAPSEGYANPYTFLVQMCLGFIRQWIRENEFEGAVIYNFEAGHKHRTDADRIMDEIQSNPVSKRFHSYAGHAFVEKQKVPIVQSADLYVWHTFTDFKRRAKGLVMRKDFEALGRPQDKAQYWTADGLREAAPYIKTYDQMGDQAQIALAALKKRLRAVGDGEGQSS